MLPTSCFLLLLAGALFSNNLTAVGASALAGEHTLVLYDAASRTVPQTALMNFIDFPGGAALPSYSEDGTVMDTTTQGSDTYAGWISNGVSISGFPILDRTLGYQVDFTILVEDESHTNNNRAGFNVILLGDDGMGIELAFWENEIWAQGDDVTGGLFNHSEGANFATTSGLTDYQVVIVGDTYTLTANAEPILNGPLRNYSGFEGFPDPYETPNFLFLGDDTTSAQARVKLGFVSVTGTQPAIPTSTSSPLLTSPPTALPSFTPNPSATSTPTPAIRFYELCPFNFSVIIIIGLLKMGYSRINYQSWNKK